MQDLSNLTHEELLQKLNEFFYQKVSDDDAINILGFLYEAKSNTKLFAKFKKEIKALKKRYKSELEQLQETDNDFKLDLGAQITKLDETIKNSNIQEIITQLRNSFDQNLAAYSEYTEQLKTILKNRITKLNHLVIYEAPPFAGNYILKSDKFDDNSISTYWYPIKDVLKNPNTNKSPLFNLVQNHIGFIDLSLVPLPLKEIRGSWSTLEKYNLKGKQLPVWLFEWAMEDFFKRIDYQVQDKPLIAIGIPNKTSVSIYDSFSTEKYTNAHITIDISKRNKKYEKLKYTGYPDIFTALKSRTLKLHKTNVTSGSGFPNGLLMKLALQLNLT